VSNQLRFRPCPHVVSQSDPRRLVDVLVAGGVQRHVAEVLPCPDVHDMAASIARTNYLARTEVRLLLEEFPPPARPTANAYRRRAVTALWAAVAVALTVALFLICSPVWRAFS
jgi:hypothetical protein